MSGLICAGDLYFDRFNDAGASAGLLLIGNATKFAPQANAKLQQRISQQKATFGQALDSVYIPDPATLDISMDEVNADNLALAFLGDSVKDTGAGGTVTAESVTAFTGRTSLLAHRDISSVSVQDDTDATTYVEGTDYTVNATLGGIFVIAGGAIDTAIQALSAGATLTLHVGYTWAAGSGLIVSGATKPTVRGRWLLDGKNLANGDSVIVDVYDAAMTPKSAVDFLGGKFVPLDLNGTMNTPTGKTTPFTTTVKAAA